MIEDDDKPIDREAWRRLLGRGGDVPPRATDERIRARARRALAPHTGRWWLPASLAASLLLAVLVVQWQYESIRTPQVVTESQIAPAAQERASEPAPPPAPTDVQDRRTADESPAGKLAQPAAVAAPSPRAAAEQQAARAEMPAPQQESVQLETLHQRPAAEANAMPAKAAAAGAVHGLTSSAEASRTPEEWYAQIEALRAAGRIEQAKAELEKLEAAYPGWLEKHLRQER